MIDIKFLRENPEVVKENIKKKFQDSKLGLVDEEFEKQRLEEMKANRQKKLKKSIKNLISTVQRYVILLNLL